MADKERAASPTDNIRQLDSGYRGFPSFREWREVLIDEARWSRYASVLAERSKVSPEILAQAQQIVTRAAAIDTGAIEGLYEVDRGFTFTVAMEATIWEAAMDARGSHVRPMFEAQLAAYEYVLDLATKRGPVTEAIIRTLHFELCRSQDTYSVATAIGVQEQPLVKGQYKSSPNHVRGRDGEMHSYAPVDLTPAEMHRLISELNSEVFLSAHPVLQASFAHYALVSVHPFADGNGRVARALASVYTYRAQSVPFLILYDHRDAYYEALAAADRRQLQPFVDFSMSRVLDAIQLVDESLRAALVPDPAIVAAGVERLFVTKAGYTHGEVDEAAVKLLQLVAGELTRLAPEYEKGALSIAVSIVTGSIAPARPDFRVPVNDPRYLQVVFGAPPPAHVAVVRRFQLEVPRDCGVDDDLTIRDAESGETFASRIEEISPPSGVLQMRVNIFARRLFGGGLVELKSRAEAAMRGKGY